jgi:hypothetical protein
MTATEALRIPICGYLAATGIKPQRVKNGLAWYASPFTNEPGARLKVNLKTNHWTDFATNTGGDIVSLVMALNKTKHLGALLILLKPELSKPVARQNQINQ